MSDQMYIKDTDETFDAIVIGSGLSGGWAAKELCERGLKTLMIERGRVVEHRKDYIGEGVAPWDMPMRGKVDNILLEQRYRIQKQCYAFNDATKHFFGNDRDLPYTTKDDTTFSWIRANQLGGKSLLWHRQSYRLSDHDFAANSLDGHGNDWPIRYADIEKWYGHVERHAGISGAKEGLEQLPDSEFLPPFDMTKPELDIKAAIEKVYPDRKMIMGRMAHLTQPSELHIKQGRVQCQARNECQKGCSFGAYFSTQSSTLPAAAATGNLHIAPNSVVHSLIYDEQSKKVRGVRVIDNDTLAEREYYAKVVFLCASTLGSTQIMLNSTSRAFPDGIANSSGVLGHYLMDHNYNAGATGDVPGYEDEYYRGRRPGGIIIPNFQYEPKRGKKNYLRGYALAGGAYREGWQQNASTKGFGEKFKQQMTQAGKWRFGLHAQGEMLPRYENTVKLHHSLKDKWGIPQLEINCRWSDNELDMMKDAADTAEEMLKVAGVENVSSYVNQGPPGLAIHELGTARMGRNPKDSVLNRFNQTHDIDNLFVTDGASFSSSAVQNPSLTFMALTARAVDYAVSEIKQGRI
ncbi:GMC family oxidoreductase [Paraglaciecola agarilytica]|uniref:GMC oxidoreductase n=1 Tax=Paraglaciecola chathamensis TaxID=368405 RepID=UPI001C0857B2|nr:GMC family oxidoreductase [Paraglaciecola agarilytica]MBU3019352.1 GMC family oxidoreductase [Paraglaciecola agarilytica]